MKITVRQIEKIIKEELPDVLKTLKANGELTEPEEDEETEEEDEIEEQNPSHDSQGQFSSKKGAVTTSTWFTDKKRKGPKGLPDPEDSGRGKYKDKGKGRWRMKDREPLWESSYKRYVQEVDSPHDEKVNAPADTYDCAKKLQDQKVLIRKMKAMVKHAEKTGSKECPLSYQDAVRIVNQLEKASRGKAYEKD